MKKNHFKILIALSVFLVECSGRKSSIGIPRVFRNINTNFETKQGITFYDRQPFSGWQYSLCENEDTVLLISFYDGKESGISKQWYENGQLKETRNYEGGKKTGEHKGWWPNGELKFVYHFTNDEYEG